MRFSRENLLLVLADWMKTGRYKWVCLSGKAGGGKTTLGFRLAGLTGASFISLDPLAREANFRENVDKHTWQWQRDFMEWQHRIMMQYIESGRKAVFDRCTVDSAAYAYVLHTKKAKFFRPEKLVPYHPKLLVVLFNQPFVARNPAEIALAESTFPVMLEIVRLRKLDYCIADKEWVECI